jgi:hypothetical protein
MVRLTSAAAIAAVLAIGMAASGPAQAQVIQRGQCQFGDMLVETQKERFMRIDRNENGFIDRKEMVHCLWRGDFIRRGDQAKWGMVADLAEEYIDKYDADDDGRLTMEEVVEPGH